MRWARHVAVIEEIRNAREEVAGNIGFVCVLSQPVVAEEYDE